MGENDIGGRLYGKEALGRKGWRQYGIFPLAGVSTSATVDALSDSLGLRPTWRRSSRGSENGTGDAIELERCVTWAIYI